MHPKKIDLFKISFPEKFTYMDDPATSHIDAPTKLTYRMMITLSHDLNFTYFQLNAKYFLLIQNFHLKKLFLSSQNAKLFRCNIVQVDSYGWLVNNTWDGVMALYAKNKVDLLLHGTSIRADRMQFVEFTTDLMPVV